MEKEFTCVVCPVGCTLRVREAENGVISVTGNRCKRGVEYGINEWTDPRRMVTSTVRVLGGRECVTSVKTKKPVPKGRILELMDQIDQIVVQAPCTEGTVVLSGLFGEENDLVITRDVVEA